VINKAKKKEKQIKTITFNNVTYTFLHNQLVYAKSTCEIVRIKGNALNKF
jgi:hypothetical protein